MPRSKLEIRQKGLNPKNMKVFLNDQEVTACLVGLEIKWEMRNVTVAKMTIIVDDLQVDSDCLAMLTARVQAKEAGVEELPLKTKER